MKAAEKETQAEARAVRALRRDAAWAARAATWGAWRARAACPSAAGEEPKAESESEEEGDDVEEAEEPREDVRVGGTEEVEDAGGEVGERGEVV